MISVIIPFYNERENLKTLLPKILENLNNWKKNYEVILVDDGSNDGGVDFFKNKMVKVLKHQKRLGKGEALKTGVEQASGELIIFMDGDWQDDPRDMEKFLEKIEAGYDFVNGKRVNRQDNFLIRIYSKLANFFLKKFLNSPYLDINCGFKAFKKKIIKNFSFYSNNFRFLPLWVYYQGFKIAEIEVQNNPRRFGRSKYGWTKITVGVLDMLTAYFLYRFSEKPLHFFGTIGGIIVIVGLIILVILAFERLFFGVLLYRRPLLFAGILLVIVGVQIVMTGILGELIVYQKKQKV